MATTTPNIGLTKPIGTENVNRSIINDNYDKIDAACGNTIELFKTIQYTYTISSINAGAAKAILRTDFDITVPSGYTPLMPSNYEIDDANMVIVSISPKVGTTPIMVVVNNSDNALTNVTVKIGLVFVKTGVL